MIGDFSALAKFFKFSKVKSDTRLFRLHYRVTVEILLIGTLIVTFNQYIGDPIDCFIDLKTTIPQKMLDQFCWIHSTHTLPNRLATDELPIPGLGTAKKGEELRHHLYYQWVGFFLLFQAITFYVPHYIWKIWERKKMTVLVENLVTPILRHEDEIAAREKLVSWLHVNLRRNQFYAWAYFACESLNALNIVGEIFLVDRFLGGEFTEYGGNVLQQTSLDPENRTDPMSYVFPTVSKCTFKDFGPSGTVETYDAYCVLPVNIFNEKFFIFLWFWYMILAILTGLGIIYRIATLVVPKFRRFILYNKGGHFGNFERQLDVVFGRCNIGGWFILSLVGENVNKWTFTSIIEDLGARIQGKDF